MCTVDLYTATAAHWAAADSHVRIWRHAHCARGANTLRFVVDPSGQFRQPFARAAPLRRDDFGGHADRGLLGGTCTEVESDGRSESRQLLLGDAEFAQPCQPVVVR